MAVPLSSQSIMIAIVYGLCAIIAAGGLVSSGNIGVGIICFIIISLYTALIVYDTNCLTKGSCNIWSWVRTIMYTILPIIMLVVSLFAFIMSKSAKKDEHQK